MSEKQVTEQVFYNGEVVLTYDDSLHQYTITEDGERFVVPSATGVGSVIEKPALVPWAAKCVVDFIRNNVYTITEGNTDSDSYHFASVIFANIRTKEEWEQFLQDAKKNFRSISETALDVGKLAHSWLEEYVKAMIAGEEYNAPLPANEAACNAIHAALDWQAAHNFRPIAAEQQVYSRELNVAGTFDWTAIIDSCDNKDCCKFQFKDAYALGDYKSSKAIYDEYRIQTAFYKYALDEMAAYEFYLANEINKFRSDERAKKVELRVILRLGKDDGTFEALVLGNYTDYELDVSAFIGALCVWSWMSQIKLDERAETKRLKLLKPKKPRKVKIPKVEEIPLVDG